MDEHQEMIAALRGDTDPAAALAYRLGQAHERLRDVKGQNARLRVALRFYANGHHFNIDSADEFDTVSGEPQNWLCSGKEDSTTMIEVGQVARLALLGTEINWLDGDDDTTPKPIDGEPPADGARKDSDGNAEADAWHMAPGCA